MSGLKTGGVFFICAWLLVLSGSEIPVFADTLFLKNGESIEGLIAREGKDYVELDLGCGLVRFGRNEVLKISRSDAAEAAEIRKRWQENKLKSEWRETEATLLRERLKKGWEDELVRLQEEERLRADKEAKQIPLKYSAGQITLPAVLNQQYPVSLILDTGASLVVLSSGSARKLGIDLDAIEKTVELQLADGRLARAKPLILESVKVNDIEEKNVAAAVLLEEEQGLGMQDGLLGMSFLGRFNFTLDLTEGKLILKKGDQ